MEQKGKLLEKKIEACHVGNSSALVISQLFRMNQHNMCIFNQSQQYWEHIQAVT